MDIKLLAENIEKNIGILLDEIERDRKAIISKARQDAMLELRNAKKLSDEIIQRANRHLQLKLKANRDIPQHESHLFDFIN